MKYLLLLALCLVFTLAQSKNDIDKEWQLFKRMHGKNYQGEEEDKRIDIFLENKKKIADHNERYYRGEVSYKMSINQFTDMLETEVKNSMNGYMGAHKKTGTPYVDDSNEPVQTSVDWRQKGAVTPVKNQGKCGSCWSFSTTGALEGAHYLQTGKLVSLSEQQLVDCSRNFGNDGCEGGLMDNAFDYIKANGGLDTEKSYPYTAEDGKCHFTKKNIGATDTGHVDLPEGDEDALKRAVSKKGPISVAIDASNFSFQGYAGGVYDEPNCSSTQLDHGVLVVGYGTEHGKEYWLVKNSWGPEWGEDGYIKMSRNQDNQCGIATQASYPTV